MSRRIISLSVDSSVYKEYKGLCKGQGIVMSKQIENFMREIIQRLKK